MKRNRIIIIVLIVVLLIIAIVLDLFWKREKYNPNVEYVPERLVDGYSLKEDNGEVILTMYGEGNAIRIINIYHFENGILVGCDEEHYCTTKLQAMFYLKDVKDSKLDVKRKGNVIYCKTTVFDYGETKEDVVNGLREVYGRYSVEVKE